MASGHVNRTNRPNTWLHRPATRREDSPCQPGAVHTWHTAAKVSAAVCPQLVGADMRALGQTPFLSRSRNDDHLQLHRLSSYERCSIASRHHYSSGYVRAFVRQTD
jgi:hypothetical protein